MGGEGKAGTGATESKMAVVLSARGVSCLELSLAEMLRQQQSEACLYHGQEVSKKWAEYFFHGKCAFVLTLQHPRLRYARVSVSVLGRVVQRPTYKSA